MIEWSRVTHWQSHVGLIPAETLQLFHFRLCGLCVLAFQHCVCLQQLTCSQQAKKQEEETKEIKLRDAEWNDLFFSRIRNKNYSMDFS